MRTFLFIALLGICFSSQLQAQTESDALEQQMRQMQEQMQQQMQSLMEQFQLSPMDTNMLFRMDTTFMMPFGGQGLEDMDGFGGENFSQEDFYKQMQDMMQQLFQQFDTEEGEGLPFFWDMQPMLPDSIPVQPKREERKIKKL